MFQCWLGCHVHGWPNSMQRKMGDKSKPWWVPTTNDALEIQYKRIKEFHHRGCFYCVLILYFGGNQVKSWIYLFIYFLFLFGVFYFFYPTGGVFMDHLRHIQAQVYPFSQSGWAKLFYHLCLSFLSFLGQIHTKL